MSWLTASEGSPYEGKNKDEGKGKNKDEGKGKNKN